MHAVGHQEASHPAPAALLDQLIYFRIEGGLTRKRDRAVPGLLRLLKFFCINFRVTPKAAQKAALSKDRAIQNISRLINPANPARCGDFCVSPAKQTAVVAKWNAWGDLEASVTSQPQLPPVKLLLKTNP
jgi:hypothetical protein